MPISRGLKGVLAGLAIAIPAAAIAAAPALTMPEIYADGDFSERAKLFGGQEVAMEGFMAPPLKVDSHFFVLTTLPMAICPFCAEISEWPEDIVVVYTNDTVAVAPYDMRIRATGTLDLGAWTDPDSGFVSKVRLVQSDVKILPTVQRGNDVNAWGIFRF